MAGLEVKRKMKKTKRTYLRASAVAVITGTLLLGAIVLPTGIGNADQEFPAPFDDWNGTWVNVGTMLDDSSMDPVYEAIADAANAAAGDGSFTADDAKIFLYAMHETNFGDLGITGNTTTYYNTNGTVKCECEYESAGIENVTFGEEEFGWYKFELTSGDAACDEYKYLILTEVHSHEGGMVHFHMKYGDTSFDDLINNTNYAIWYPTLAAEGTTVEDVADGYMEGAEKMGYMMLAWFGDPWRDFDPEFLPAEITDISGTYMKTGEGISLDLEGNFIPVTVEQITGTIVVEQHGSLLKVIDTSDGEEIICQGSTVGDNIMLSNGGYAEVLDMGMMRLECVSTGNIEEGAEGPEIFLNWVWRMYDSDNNLIINGAGTQVWEQVED
jgi:Zn/Cd-binding protein ZinT